MTYPRAPARCLERSQSGRNCALYNVSTPSKQAAKQTAKYWYLAGIATGGSAAYLGVTEHDPDPEGRAAQSAKRFSEQIMLKD
jgi:hypothetical protein